MKILVTGATGFVGQHLIPKLDDYSLKLIVRSISNEYLTNIQIVYDKDNNLEFKQEIIDFNPDVVIHLASYLTSADDFNSIANVIESNITFTSILLESLKDTNVKLFINTGTFAEFYYNDGQCNPAYFYAASKIASRPIIKYFKNLIGFKTINIVPYTIYGGKSKSKKVIDFLIDSLNNEIATDMTSGEQILDFIHIEDVVNFYIHCLNNIDLLNDEDDYHLGSGIGTSIKDLSRLIENKLSKKVNINWGAKEYRELDIMRAIAPIYKLRKELNWQPTISLKNGIKRVINGEEK